MNEIQKGNFEIAKMLGFVEGTVNKKIMKFPSNGPDINKIPIELTDLIHTEDYAVWKGIDLKFDTDFTWQMIVLNFIITIGKSELDVNGNTYDYKISNNYCTIFNKFNKGSFTVEVIAETKSAIFQCLVTFAEHYNGNI